MAAFGSALPAGSGVQWANPGKPTRHVRISIDRLSEFAGFNFPSEFAELELRFVAEVGGLNVLLPTLKEIKRNGKKRAA